MSFWLSLLAGLFCKTYDDIKDNNILKSFRNDTLLEYLKGMHYILFTIVSINDPMFFYINYIMNVLNHIKNNNAYSAAYEYSLLFSFPILFLIVSIPSSPTFLEYIIFIYLCIGMYIEPIISKFYWGDEEVSHFKLYFRISVLLFVLLIIYLDISKTVNNCIYYFLGYIGLSIIVQCYSLYINKKSRLANHINVIDKVSVTDKKSVNDEVTVTNKNNVANEMTVTNKTT